MLEKQTLPEGKAERMALIDNFKTVAESISPFLTDQSLVHLIHCLILLLDQNIFDHSSSICEMLQSVRATSAQLEGNRQTLLRLPPLVLHPAVIGAAVGNPALESVVSEVRFLFALIRGAML